MVINTYRRAKNEVAGVNDSIISSLFWGYLILNIILKLIVLIRKTPNPAEKKKKNLKPEVPSTNN